MRFSLGCELSYSVQTPATLILNIEAMNGGWQRVLAERFEVTPSIGSEAHRAVESDNLYRRLALAPGEYAIRYSAEVELTPTYADPGTIGETPVGALPLEALPYLYPSRFCQSDVLARFAWRQFGNLAPGHDRVAAICNWIHDNVDYIAGTSDSGTSAADTFALRAGVCRDFAHLGITFCRALGIPARFASVYAWQLAPQDFHAVFEAYLDGNWFLFDATRLSPIDGLVRIGEGRDAADTSFATFYGVVIPGPMRVWIDPLDANDSSKPWTIQAVSVATA